MTGRRRAIAVVAVLVVIVGGAWLLQARKGGAAAPGSPGAAAYTVAVTRNGSVVRRFTVADLRALPQSAETIDGKTQDGPLVSAVLAAAGVRGYTQLTVKGAGVRDSGSLTLRSPHIPAGLMVDFSDRGTVKVCCPTLAWGQWVRDVTAIDAH